MEREQKEQQRKREKEGISFDLKNLSKMDKAHKKWDKLNKQFSVATTPFSEITGEIEGKKSPFEGVQKMLQIPPGKLNNNPQLILYFYLRTHQCCITTCWMKQRCLRNKKTKTPRGYAKQYILLMQYQIQILWFNTFYTNMSVLIQKVFNVFYYMCKIFLPDIERVNNYLLIIKNQTT